jgi:hypothetical protein
MNKLTVPIPQPGARVPEKLGERLLLSTLRQRRNFGNFRKLGTLSFVNPRVFKELHLACALRYNRTKIECHESSADVEDTENDRRTRRGLTISERIEEDQVVERQQFFALATDEASPLLDLHESDGGARRCTVSGPMRSRGYRACALPGLYPQVDRKKPRPIVDIVVRVKNLSSLRLRCHTHNRDMPSYPNLSQQYWLSETEVNGAQILRLTVTALI